MICHSDNEADCAKSVFCQPHTNTREIKSLQWMQPQILCRCCTRGYVTCILESRLEGKQMRHRKYTHISRLAAGLVGSLSLLAVVGAGCATPSGSDEPKESTEHVSEPLVPHPRLLFGVRGQDSYENNWCNTNNNAWNNCDGFGKQLQSTDDWAYYYTLVGAKPRFETTGDTVGEAPMLSIYFSLRPMVEIGGPMPFFLCGTTG